MVFSILSPAPGTYLLWHRFTMPTASRTQDAVAVSAYAGSTLLAAYTFLLGHIVMLVWGILVFIAVLILASIYGYEHPSSSVSAEIYSKRSSPHAIFLLAVRNFSKVKHVRWLIVLWITISLSFLVVNYAVPIIFAPYIIIGSAAPVNSSAVFVPSRNNTDGFTNSSNINNLEIFNFYVPSALRAVGSIDSLNQTSGLSPSLSVDQPETIGVNDDGGLVTRIGYRYNVTGLDFGLQHYPDLVFSVEGSCITEYGWWAGSTTNDTDFPGAYVEGYNPFNDPNSLQYVSLYDGGPRAFFFVDLPANPTSNLSWAAIVSSVNRTSWFPSTDPWYQTDPNPFYDASQLATTVAPHTVRPQRPALSCWENDVWSYQGHSGPLASLPTLPNLSLSPGILTIFADALGLPMIYLLGTYLQVSALDSSITALGDIVDARSASLHADLTRLVYASYIATVNCLTETTLFPPADGFLNEVAPNGIFLAGAGDFVIYSDAVATLSVRALILIPTIAAALWILSIALLFLPITKKIILALTTARVQTGTGEVGPGPGLGKEGEAKESRALKMLDTVLTTALSISASQDSIKAA